ncbi:PEGA domain-containing protein [Pendulispora albinea]|uniref:PEGA domain-containing protein n=1 Tax=Pendulispora albinea TaxID=2741071 RepID=A0ABZ2LP95_9BACT
MERTVRHRRWFGIGALAGALTLVGPAGLGVAHAQQAKPAPAQPQAGAGPTSPAAVAAEAKKNFQAGETKFKAGDFAGALSAFQTSDSLKPTPQGAHYIALSQDKLGQYPEAVAAYERFLSEVPANMKKEGEEATKRVSEIKAMPGKVHVEAAPAAAKITVDGAPTASPAPADLELAPGKHAIHVAADGFVAQDKEVDVTFASKQNVKVELEAAAPPPVAAPVPAAEPPPPAAPETPPPAPRSKVPAFVTGGVALAAAGVGTVFGIMALSDKSDFDKNPTAAKADDGENHALIADMAIGVAITLGITSAVLFFSADEPAAKAAKAAPNKNVASAPKPVPVTIRPAPIVTTHGGGAGALIRF